MWGLTASNDLRSALVFLFEPRFLNLSISSKVVHHLVQKLLDQLMSCRTEDFCIQYATDMALVRNRYAFFWFSAEEAGHPEDGKPVNII